MVSKWRLAPWHPEALTPFGDRRRKVKELSPRNRQLCAVGRINRRGLDFGEAWGVWRTEIHGISVGD